MCNTERQVRREIQPQRPNERRIHVHVQGDMWIYRFGRIFLEVAEDVPGCSISSSIYKLLRL